MLTLSIHSPAMSISAKAMRTDGHAGDILRAFQGPDIEKYFIVGEDALETLKVDPVAASMDVRLLCARRGGDLPAALKSPSILPLSAIGISATMIRDRVKRGLSIRYMVPPAVEDYIREHELYKGGESS